MRSASAEVYSTVARRARLSLSCFFAKGSTVRSRRYICPTAAQSPSGFKRAGKLELIKVHAEFREIALRAVLRNRTSAGVFNACEG